MEISVKERIDHLRKELNNYNYLYYVKNKPIISDLEFDMKLKELEMLEKENPEFYSELSPTQRVGGEPAKGFIKIKHEIPMLSLANTYNRAEIEDFDRRIKQSLEVSLLDYFVELKIDGLSLNLVYEKGRLVSASTRGDGVTGELVTENVKRIRSIPLELFEPVTITVRGEVYFPITSFIKMNEKRIKNNEEVFSNPRNAASGTLRQLNPAIVYERNLSFFAHSFGSAEVGFKATSQKEMFENIEGLGLPVNPHGKLCESISEIFDYCNYWENNRKSLDYDIDGVVIKINDFNNQKLLGATAKSPRWAISYKFKAENAISRVNNIVFQVGRTGVVTPVAELEPVEIGGVTVKRSTLHNFEEIERLGLMNGDFVEVERAADVIPRVNKVMEDKRDGTQKKIIVPESCPHCGSKLNFRGAYLKCENVDCPARIIATIQNFASRSAMNIEGMGDAIVELFIKEGLIKNISDIYSLNIEAIQELSGMGLKSAENLINSIEKSKKNGMSRLVMGLGIPGIGENSAKLLSQKYRDIKYLKDAEYDDLLKIDGIGEQSALNIISFFENEENIKVLYELIEKGVNTKYDEESGRLSGISFVVTGSFSEYSRDDIHEIISNNGGAVKKSISNKVDYLITGENAGSKLEKAKKIGVSVISLEEFMEMIAS